MKSGRNWGRLGMTFNIKQVQLKDLLLEPIRNGLTKPKAIRGRGVPMIAMGEIFANNRIFSFPMERVPVTDKELSSSSIYEGDLLFARQSLVLEGAGKCCIVKEVNEPTVFESHLIRVRLDNSKALPDYIYYYFNSYQGKENIKTIVEQVAAAGIRGRDLVNLYIPIPPITVQQQILQVLMSIDDKIAINTTINENLEQQAQAIFKSWFGADIENLNSSNCKSLGELVTSVDNRGKTPPLSNEKTEYPIIDVRALSGSGRIINFSNCTKYVEEETYNNWFRNGHPKDYDILISTVGSLAEMKIYLGNIGCIAQNVVGFRSKGLSPIYLYQYLNYIRKELVSYNIGSVQPSIKVTHIIKHPIFIPENDKIEKFDMLIKDYTLKIYNNCCENKRLVELRDTLLPKLMNGEIDVSKVKI